MKRWAWPLRRFEDLAPGLVVTIYTDGQAYWAVCNFGGSRISTVAQRSAGLAYRTMLDTFPAARTAS